MGALLQTLSGWKTYIAVAAAVLTAIAGYLNGSLTPMEALTAIFLALGQIAHRLTTGNVIAASKANDVVVTRLADNAGVPDATKKL